MFEEDGEVFALVGGQKARDVLDENPLGSESISDAYELEEEPASRSSQSSTLSSHREVLAWKSSANKVNSFEFIGVHLPHVAVPGNIGPVAFKDAGGERLDLALPGASHSRALHREVDAADAAEQAAEGHSTRLPSARSRIRRSVARHWSAMDTA